MSKKHQFCSDFMTAERLIRLLQHPEQLERIPYEELKTLVLAYPYAHHLRQLLLFKSQQIQHHETERNLAAAAAYSLDRGLLFKHCTPNMVRQQVEVLELKPIETVLRNLEAIAPVERKEMVAPPPAETTQINDNQEIKITPPPIDVPAPVFEIPPITPPESPVAEAPETVVAAPPTVVVSAPLPSFSVWVTQFNLPPIPPRPYKPTPIAADDDDQAEEEVYKPPVAVREKSMAQQLAEKSVSEKEEVVSETLAKLMARQGHREKAISMYERLIVANPEKSAIFAAAIQELKK